MPISQIAASAWTQEEDDLLALIDELDIEDVRDNFKDLMIEVIAVHSDDNENSK